LHVGEGFETCLIFGKRFGRNHVEPRLTIRTTTSAVSILRHLIAGIYVEAEKTFAIRRSAPIGWSHKVFILQ
jgi:hypothetical protein